MSEEQVLKLIIRACQAELNKPKSGFTNPNTIDPQWNTCEKCHTKHRILHSCPKTKETLEEYTKRNNIKPLDIEAYQAAPNDPPYVPNPFPKLECGHCGGEHLSCQEANGKAIPLGYSEVSTDAFPSTAPVEKEIPYTEAGPSRGPDYGSRHNILHSCPWCYKHKNIERVVERLSYDNYAEMKAATEKERKCDCDICVTSLLLKKPE